jgi:two-component system LytT family response regulator
MKAIIVDDERLARNELKRLLENFPHIEVIGEAANTDEVSELLETHQPDVLFLDIQMPKLTGLELLELLPNPPIVVFSTAYDQYAIEAFEKNAVDLKED